MKNFIAFFGALLLLGLSACQTNPCSVNTQIFTPEKMSLPRPLFIVEASAFWATDLRITKTEIALDSQPVTIKLPTNISSGYSHVSNLQLSLDHQNLKVITSADYYETPQSQDYISSNECRLTPATEVARPNIAMATKHRSLALDDDLSKNLLEQIRTAKVCELSYSGSDDINFIPERSAVISFVFADNNSHQEISIQNQWNQYASNSQKQYGWCNTQTNLLYLVDQALEDLESHGTDTQP